MKQANFGTWLDIFSTGVTKLRTVLHDVLGISDIDQCKRCPGGFHCFPDKARFLCPEGKYRRRVETVEGPYLLNFTRKGENFQKEIENPDGYNKFECADCEPGYYCELQSVDDDEIKEEGDKVPTKCPQGTYQPEKGKSHCIPCNIGAGENCPEGSASIVRGLT